ncbi:hypothetical protein C0Q70_00975 [Pomacea canaliculata]|uniref:ABC-2 type transporter transmembrane domain-containing protein n=1 Tax=Pomacea canaliculata TaxID=400727 RepID=A0A2T7PY58_POMCA|nr:hypothetical protein C0Q70_00975 [Pomacea canaliculata]
MISPYNKQLLVVAPSHIDVKPVMRIISGKLQNINYTIYPTKELAEEAYEQDRDNVAAGIIFSYLPSEGNGSSVLSYAIRMSCESSPDTGTIFRQALDQGGCRGDDNKQGSGTGDCLVNMYLQNGFVYLQTIIDWALMQNENITVPFMDVNVQLMPKNKYTPDLTYLQTVASIYFVMAYSFFINFLTINLVAEKEKKIREGMFMMGLRNSVFWLSWSAVYFLIILLVTVLVVILASVGKFFQHSNIFLLFVMLMLYGLSIIALAFLLTPFFSKARTAGSIASFSTIVISLLYLAVSQTRTTTPNGYQYAVPPSAQWVMCLLSPIALALAMDQGIFLDIAKGGMNFDTISLGDFPLQAPLIMLVVDIILYFLLAIYLDHVIPGEYGVRYKPWYFLQCSYWFPQKSSLGERTQLVRSGAHDDNEDIVSGPDIEPVTHDMHNKRALRIINITKEFKSKETVTAVKGTLQ